MATPPHATPYVKVDRISVNIHSGSFRLDNAYNECSNINFSWFEQLCESNWTHFLRLTDSSWVNCA